MVFLTDHTLTLENPWASVQAFAKDSSFILVPQSFVTTGAWNDLEQIAGVTAPL